MERRKISKRPFGVSTKYKARSAVLTVTADLLFREELSSA